jgi:putative ATPase
LGNCNKIISGIASFFEVGTELLVTNVKDDVYVFKGLDDIINDMNTKNNTSMPLASRMRPKAFRDFFGHGNLVEKDAYLKRIIDTDALSSMIFWGPPGTGKTTLAQLIAEKTKADFIKISAVDSGAQKLRSIIVQADENFKNNKRTILFLDEIHRWNKAQQDKLLPYVERGLIVLIGATTENPSFEINSALLSRARVFVLHKLEVPSLEKIIKRALTDKKAGLGEKNIKISKETITFLAHISNGDARIALNVLEASSNYSNKIDNDLIKKIIQKTNLIYDKNGEEHYNIISALHKSMRGGDADAAVYWMVRMLEGGEDPIYIARRLVRFASEDIGLANNTALLLANATFDACQKLGVPECNVHLSQCVIYLAKSPKSIVAYEAYNKAKKDVEEFGNLFVPQN